MRARARCPPRSIWRRPSNGGSRVPLLLALEGGGGRQRGAPARRAAVARPGGRDSPLPQYRAPQRRFFAACAWTVLLSRLVFRTAFFLLQRTLRTSVCPLLSPRERGR